jgi:hypothetical protein
MQKQTSRRIAAAEPIFTVLPQCIEVGKRILEDTLNIGRSHDSAFAIPDFRLFI